MYNHVFLKTVKLTSFRSLLLKCPEIFAEIVIETFGMCFIKPLSPIEFNCITLSHFHRFSCNKSTKLGEMTSSNWAENHGRYVLRQLNENQ